MNILKMDSEDAWYTPGLEYVGKSSKALVLANPWNHRNGRHVRYLTTNRGEALYRYREWMMTRLIPNWVSGLKYHGLHDWEKEYLARVVDLSERIERGEVTSLGCWCINVENYLMVPSGTEKCHAEILYKACSHLIAHRQGAML
ncbi:DUF4326 domain-containing protein [Nostoc sp. TCL26-01]|uniref:DUF4326 domain-containing protein n=1 Tax=Nostoc sp. TCL26-01 TaxID=2576904 RepID=UPI0015BF7886|nr:DUF4326 domain-containing protein [Nostoc sp. TCL26-01]QLE54827.1 DUF4326 domain-containing protein [Nostoc sp. TCL26-01]QLE58755.1 DUF4326 domain-containing protein [Nostoc sp. TCL26-01]